MGHGGLLGAGLGCALVLGLLTAGPAAADTLDCPGPLSERLECLDRETARDPGPDVVEVKGRIELGRPVHQLSLSDHRWRLARSGLAVEVPDKQTTGQGGSVLLLLAKDRRVADGSRITPLDPSTLTAVKAAGLCAGRPARELCAALAREQSGEDLVRGDLADPLGGDDGGDGALWVLFGVIAALFALVVFLLKAVQRPAHAVGHARPARHAPGRIRSASAGPGGAADQVDGLDRRDRPERDRLDRLDRPDRLERDRLDRDRLDRPAESDHPDPTRTMALQPVRHRAPRQPAAPVTPFDVPPAPPHPQALVRTPLVPEGYVEIDRCLHRARWTGGPASAPPAVGEFVGVRDVSENSDPSEQAAPHLLALPLARTPQHSGDSHDE
ncbi:hypothetical protein H9Y04_34595 [Streptomyces sp. TRM66268-LWL]|uniref:Secreted protein n=1 Tax=Streptomyces polyasparticus TaxID=2767826 RepID=A0ABR7SS06_9ACTN|nr:hypothetical protein [Streptomyces polyasparticus]MBC9717674.1 hypothetical protein [Streptomyces polyasparticus]